MKWYDLAKSLMKTKGINQKSWQSISGSPKVPLVIG